MKPRITVITLGVDDLERALRFYRDGLGLRTRGIVGTEFEHGAVAFFDLQYGLKLAIWPRKDIAHEAKVPLGPRSATEFALGHNVGSKAEVDVVMAQVYKAGAIITDPPHDAFWGGYSGSFQDPDGHLWEVAWNPDWELAD
jgi:catechol 2,3-dioxygenase-like lactoylglutathione lyase family enzyme